MFKFVEKWCKSVYKSMNGWGVCDTDTIAKNMGFWVEYYRLGNMQSSLFIKKLIPVTSGKGELSYNKFRQEVRKAVKEMASEMELYKYPLDMYHECPWEFEHKQLVSLKFKKECYIELMERDVVSKHACLFKGREDETF